MTTPLPELGSTTVTAGYTAIGLHNPKNLQNVGGVLRAAYCFGAALVVISGSRYRPQSTDTPKAYRFLPVLQVDELHSVIPFDCVPVAVERLPNSAALPDYAHPERAFYIFGPEDGDLGRAITDWCRDVVSIPSGDSLNLAAAVNIVLYDRMAKQLRAGCPPAT